MPYALCPMHAALVLVLVLYTIKINIKIIDRVGRYVIFPISKGQEAWESLL
jgi:hypothetical protein